MTPSRAWLMKSDTGRPISRFGMREVQARHGFADAFGDEMFGQGLAPIPDLRRQVSRVIAILYPLSGGMTLAPGRVCERISLGRERKDPVRS
jgi:hypothetical protein